MFCMKRCFLLILLSVIFSLSLSVYDEGDQVCQSKDTKHITASSGTQQTPSYPLMPGPGKKVLIGKDYYFTYGFDKKPKMGIVIMKVELYARDGKKETSLEVKADVGMPSMRGAHETGDRSFKLSKNGDYLLPIDIVMPG